MSEDAKFLSDILAQICNYAVKNNMIPDETIKTVSENMLSLLEISSFNGWEVDK